MSLDYAVLTPEKVVVGYRLASIGSRVSALALDILLSGAVLMAVLISISVTLASLSPAIGFVLQMLVSSFGIFLYFGLLEAYWNGQTVGKKAMGIRVRMQDGTPITFQAAAFRTVLRPADLVPLPFLGLLTIFLNPRAQRLGDLAAGTVVVHERRAVPRFTPSPHVYGVHPFEEHVGALRTMTPAEYVAIKRLADRFPELSPVVQSRNLKEVWEPFAAKHRIAAVPNVHPVYLMEAVVMRFGRDHGLI